MEKMNSSTYKIVIVGDGAVGKSTYLKRHIEGDFNKEYRATIGVEVHPVKFLTNKGDITFNVWDIAGQEKFGGLRDGYYVDTQGAIVMFDVGNAMSFKKIFNWIRDVKRVAGEIPIVVVGNKCDLVEHKVKMPQIQSVVSKHGYTYYDLSAKSYYNFEKPFLYLARKLYNENVQFEDRVYRYASDGEDTPSEEESQEVDSLCDRIDGLRVKVNVCTMKIESMEKNIEEILRLLKENISNEIPRVAEDSHI